MKNSLHQNALLSDRYSTLYPVLEEGGYTKLALYREICAALQCEFELEQMNVLDIDGGLGNELSLPEPIMEDDPRTNWITFDSAHQMGGSSIIDANSSESVDGILPRLLPFQSNSFNLIFGANLLSQWIDEQHIRTFLPEILRVLKPTGILIISHPVKRARFSKIISFETGLPAALPPNGAVIAEIAPNLAFLSMQRKLAAEAATSGTAPHSRLASTMLKPFLFKFDAGYTEQVTLIGWIKLPSDEALSILE